MTSANSRRDDAKETVLGLGELDRRGFLRAGAGAVALGAGGALLTACGSGGSGGSSGSSAPLGLSRAPTTPFDPNVKAGSKPNLPRRIAWSLPAGAELFTRFDRAVRIGAGTHGLEYVSGQANGDSSTQFQQTQQFIARGLGALVIVDLAPPALAPLQLQAIKQGICVLCGPFADSTLQLTADQGKIGHAAGVATVQWINQNLGGKAQVALFNNDTTPSQRPKSQAVRDALKAAGGGIELVADVGVVTATGDEGFRLTNTILQRHPNVDVWVGNDGPLIGALAALQAAGKAGGSALFGFGDGDRQALDAIARGGPYKSTQGISYSPVAYGWGKYASDWLDGKSIPMVLSVEPFEINSKATVDAFNAAESDPKTAFEDNQASHRYFTPLGNTSYEHNRYLKVVA